MWHLYRTLTSDVTSDYSGNVANKFKVKLNLRLAGEGWKVAIISAMVPKMALFKDLQTSTDPLIALYGRTEKFGSAYTWVQGAFKGTDLPPLEKSQMSTTVEDLFNGVRHRIDETGHGKLGTGYKFSSNWMQLAWDKSGAQPELILKTSERMNVIYLHKTFAKLMGRTKTDTSGAVSLGTNMAPDYTKYGEGESSLGNAQKFVIKFNTYVQLNSLSDWRMINLKQSFAEALNLHARPLTVSAKVTSGTGANKVTHDQPMSHLYYAPQARERYIFTPPLEEFHPVHTHEWDEVEISLQELDGSAVKFQPDSQCVLHLHFQQD